MFDSLVEYVHAFPFKQKEHDEQLTLFTKNKGKRRVSKMWRGEGGVCGKVAFLQKIRPTCRNVKSVAFIFFLLDVYSMH